MSEVLVKLEDDSEISLNVKKPSYQDIEESDRVYASKVASLVRENTKRKLLLRQEVENFLKVNSIWTEEDSKTIEKLNSEIDSLLNVLRKGGIKKSLARNTCIQVMDKRKDLFALMNKRRILDDSTVEAVAEREKEDYLIYASVFKGSELYWQSFDDMKNDKLGNVYLTVTPKFYEIMYGTNGEFEKNLPENKWLKKHNFIDDNLNYVNPKTGEKVDRDGNLLTDLQDKIKKQVENLNGEIVEEVPFLDD